MGIVQIQSHTMCCCRNSVSPDMRDVFDVAFYEHYCSREAEYNMFLVVILRMPTLVRWPSYSVDPRR